MHKITPIILAGGVGTRLWPISRESYPKQFLRIGDTDSLFQRTVRRFLKPEYARPIIVTNESYRFHVIEQMGAIGALPELILLEPFSRDTAGAICAASLAQARTDPNAFCIIAPSDHVLPDDDLFAQSVQKGMVATAAGEIVTFGIRPDRPETGYEYLELDGISEGSTLPISVRSFTEKPSIEAAQRMVTDGKHLWNAGIFLFQCSEVLEAFNKHAPQIAPLAKEALDNRELDLGFTRLSKSAWAKLPDISFDYAVMEHAKNVSAVPYSGHWSDLGTWEGLWREECSSEAGQDGVAQIGNAHSIDCRNTLLMSENEDQVVVGVGLSDLVAVAMKDAVLVADRNRAGDIGSVVKYLTERDIQQATTSPKDFRPWGWFEELISGSGFQVKLICVHPRGVLSLQSHEFRAEHWVVVKGFATLTVGNNTFDLEANQSAYIPQQEIHRLENRGTSDVFIIEVQTGAYLGEDDIIRYDDAYARK